MIADVDYAPRRLRAGTAGRMLVVPGVWLPFAITELRGLPDATWTWSIGPLPGAAHRVRADPARRGRTLVTFEFPGWFPGYLSMTWLALRRLEAFVSS